MSGTEGIEYIPNYPVIELNDRHVCLLTLIFRNSAVSFPSEWLSHFSDDNTR